MVAWFANTSSCLSVQCKEVVWVWLLIYWCQRPISCWGSHDLMHLCCKPGALHRLVIYLFCPIFFLASSLNIGRFAFSDLAKGCVVPTGSMIWSRVSRCQDDYTSAWICFSSVRAPSNVKWHHRCIPCLNDYSVSMLLSKIQKLFSFILLIVTLEIHGH